MIECIGVIVYYALSSSVLHFFTYYIPPTHVSPSTSVRERRPGGFPSDFGSPLNRFVADPIIRSVHLNFTYTIWPRHSETLRFRLDGPPFLYCSTACRARPLALVFRREAVATDSVIPYCGYARNVQPKWP